MNDQEKIDDAEKLDFSIQGFCDYYESCIYFYGKNNVCHMKFGYAHPQCLCKIQPIVAKEQ